MGHGHRFCARTYCRADPVQGQLAARRSASRDGRLRDGSGDCGSDMAEKGSLGTSFNALTSFDRGGAEVRVLTVQKREDCRKRGFGVGANIGKQTDYPERVCFGIRKKRGKAWHHDSRAFRPELPLVGVKGDVEQC